MHKHTVVFARGKEGERGKGGVVFDTLCPPDVQLGVGRYYICSTHP